MEAAKRIVLTPATMLRQIPTMITADILVPVIITIAFFGEAIFGFGGGLISIPLISLLLGVKEAVTLVLIFQFCMGLLIWKSYEHIDWKNANPLSWGAVAGTIAGTLLLSQASVIFLQLFLATAIFLFLIKTFYLKTLVIRKGNTATAIGAGLGGGLLQGLIGTGGPVLIMYLSGSTPQKLAMRATLIYVFFISGLVRVGISIPNHLFTPDVIHFALISMPFFLVAILAGQRIHHRVKDTYYKLAVNLVLAGSAIALICKMAL